MSYGNENIWLRLAQESDDLESEIIELLETGVGTIDDVFKIRDRINEIQDDLVYIEESPGFNWDYVNRVQATGMRV